MGPGASETFGEGYALSDDYYLCRPCFDDFRDMFGWTVNRVMLSTPGEREKT